MDLAAYLIRDLHISASGMELVRHVHAKLEPNKRRSRAHRATRHQLYREAIEAHRRHQIIARRFGL